MNRLAGNGVKPYQTLPNFKGQFVNPRLSKESYLPGLQPNACHNQSRILFSAAVVGRVVRSLCGQRAQMRTASVAQVSNPQAQWLTVQPADWKSSTQQVGNLRYKASPSKKLARGHGC